MYKGTRQTYCISFACRDAKADKNGKAFISVIIIINGERTTFNLPRKEEPTEFKKAMASNRTNPIRDYCYAVEKRLDEAANRLVMENMPLTAAGLKQEYMTGSGTYRLERLKMEYLAEAAGRHLTKRTMDRYRDAIDIFIKLNGNKEIHTVTLADCKKFLQYMTSNFEQSTAYGMFTKCKSFFIYACDCNIISKNPFGSLRTGRGMKHMDILSDDDYEAIRDADMPFWRMERIRDMFVFACNTGLAWTDCYHLRPEDFTEVNGSYCISKPRVKTGVPYLSVLLPDGVEIAKKYNFDFSSLQISNQHTNLSLKDIQMHCNVTSVDSLTFHCARHFYIQKLTTAGVNAMTVMRTAGHTNIFQTYGYTNLSKKDVVAEVSRHFNLTK